MNRELAAELVAMKTEDLRVREELARDGSLFQGYHPRMEAVHRQNAARLREIIAEHGWPGHSLVGEEATYAAWMIVQHSIGEPEFMRKMLEVFKKEVARGELSAKWAATTDDRIRMYEGRPQLYATNSYSDETGKTTYGPIEDPEHLDERRASVGLPPFEHPGPVPNEPVPKSASDFYRESMEWLYRVGWRK